MNQNEITTIAAIATAQAPGGIGIIRISGRDARMVADRVFLAAKGKTIAETSGYQALYGKVYRNTALKQAILDEAIALVFAAPASFTGEDVVELSCHGGLYLLRRVLSAVYAAGAIPASPGEFTRRAFLNGKLGLTEAESVMQLIGAQGEQAVRAALAGHGGALERRIEAMRGSLVDLASHLAAWADYPDDDIPQVSDEMLKTSLAFTRTELEKLLSQFDAGKVLRDGVDTVIAGRPNVGKSTLMNLLSGCERSIVTQYAGTTRDIVEETVLLGDVPLRLADTAGIRTTDDPVEQIGVTRARERVKTAQLVLAVFDSSQELNAEDWDLIADVKGIPAVAVVNKSDLEGRIDSAKLQSGFSAVVSISALTGEGFEELKTTVAQVLQVSALNPSEGLLFTERQRDSARRAMDCVVEAETALCSGMTLDAVTVSVEGAVTALLDLTGERATVAVVDSVFEKFCVGK